MRKIPLLFFEMLLFSRSYTAGQEMPEKHQKPREYEEKHILDELMHNSFFLSYTVVTQLVNRCCRKSSERSFMS